MRVADDQRTSLGLLLVRARRAKCLTLREASAALGISQHHLTKIETGSKGPPKLALAVAMVRIYGVQLDDIAEAIHPPDQENDDMDVEQATPKRRGRPEGSGAGRTAVIPPQRVTPEQRETWDALGDDRADRFRDWLDREARRLARLNRPQG